MYFRKSIQNDDMYEYVDEDVKESGDYSTLHYLRSIMKTVYY